MSPKGLHRVWASRARNAIGPLSPSDGLTVFAFGQTEGPGVHICGPVLPGSKKRLVRYRLLLRGPNPIPVGIPWGHVTRRVDARRDYMN
jgi:hypothetical protein